MGVHSNRRGSGKWWRTTQPNSEHRTGGDNTISNLWTKSRRRCNNSNWKIKELLRLSRSIQSNTIHTKQSRRSLSIFTELFWTWNDQSNNNSKSNRNRKRNQYNKHLLKLGKQLCLISVLGATVTPAYAENVSATANPIANCSGSVTNQAIQVLQGPYITNTYGNGIQCQGSTVNFTPYIQYSNSWKDPFERHYMEPQYNMSDYTGKMTTQLVTVKNYPWYDGWKRGPNNADGTMGDLILDDDGNKIPIAENWYNNSVMQDANGNILYNVDPDGNQTPIRYIEDGADMQIEVEVDGGDGVPDNPGEVTWEKPVRTNNYANNNFNLGLSATLSIPLDRKLQNLCKEAASTQIAQQVQLTANKRLDFEIARLKNCGELMKAGIFFAPKSPYAAICADVMVTNPPGTLTPHSHDFPRPIFKEDQQTISPSTDGQLSHQHSLPSASTFFDPKKVQEVSSPSSSESSQSSSSPQASLSSGANLLGVWQVGRMK